MLTPRRVVSALRCWFLLLLCALAVESVPSSNITISNGVKADNYGDGTKPATVIIPGTVLQYVEFSVECAFSGFLSDLLPSARQGSILQINVSSTGKHLFSSVVELASDRVTSLKVPIKLERLNGESIHIYLSSANTTITAEGETFVIPGVLSLLPAVAVLVVAIVSKQVLLALYTGIFVGATMAANYNPLVGFLRSVDLYMYGSLGQSNLGLLLFTMFMAAMIGVISKSGGILGVAKLLRRFAKSPRRAMLSTYLFGLLIFFDDYTNSLVVGPTMRPLSDGLYVSREKLAFIVDATSAPIVSVAFISSWIGFEVGLIQQQFERLGIERDAYLTFIQTIPMRYYSFLMLFFVLLCIITRRDFGPMLKAETRAGMDLKVISPRAKPASNAAGDKDLIPGDEVPPRWANGLVPIIVLVVSIALGLYFDGSSSLSGDLDAVVPANASFGESLALLISHADSSRVLLWSSMGSLCLAMVLPVAQRIVKFNEVMDAAGIRAVMGGLLILIFAWSIGDVSQALQTGPFMASVIGDALPIEVLPVISMILSAVVSFATGSSWGAMAILFPLVVPLAHSVGGGDEFNTMAAISSILAGSIFGDHCSPISDTTVFSSMACSCDHIDHVKTQIPYALIVGSLALVCTATVPFVGQWFAFVAIAICCGVLVGVLFLFGRIPPRALALTPDRPVTRAVSTPMSKRRKSFRQRDRMKVFWKKIVYTFSPPKVKRRLLQSPDVEMVKKKLRHRPSVDDEHGDLSDRE